MVFHGTARHVRAALLSARAEGQAPIPPSPIKLLPCSQLHQGRRLLMEPSRGDANARGLDGAHLEVYTIASEVAARTAREAVAVTYHTIRKGPLSMASDVIDIASTGMNDFWISRPLKHVLRVTHDRSSLFAASYSKRPCDDLFLCVFLTLADGHVARQLLPCGLIR